MIKQLYVLLILTGCCTALHAQPELIKTVVASSGGNFANGTLTLSSTVAELTMVTSFSAGTADLFQGFQNSAWIIQDVYVNPAAHNELTVLLYPNPASTFLNLDMTKHNGSALHIVLYDLLGHAVVTTSVAALQDRVRIDVSRLPSGLYSLVIADRGNQKIFNQSVSVIR